MYTLHDTFNARPLSRHRSIVATIRAMRQHISAVRRRNGPGSYVTYSVTDDAGKLVPPQEIEAAEYLLIALIRR